MKKLYLHPLTKEFVSKEIYFKFILSKDFPKSPYSEKMKQIFNFQLVVLGGFNRPPFFCQKSMFNFDIYI